MPVYSERVIIFALKTNKQHGRGTTKHTRMCVNDSGAEAKVGGAGN